MRPHNKSLFLALTVLLALTPACSSNTSPEQRVEAKTTDAQAQQNSTAVAAIVEAKKANLRETPSQSAKVVSTLNKGDLLSITDARPVGPWYRIRDSKTGTEGWIHGNTIQLLQTGETSTATTTSAQRPRTVSPPAQSPRTTVSNTATPAVDTSTPADRSSPASGTSTRASGKSYVNVDGVRVPSPVFSDTRPAGATARCRDGSYSFSQHRRGTCSHHGGVAVWY